MIRISREIRSFGQWSVTRYGVECREPGYSIAWDRIHQTSGGITWEQHMAEKPWVDMESFRAAMAYARSYGGERN